MDTIHFAGISVSLRKDLFNNPAAARCRPASGRCDPGTAFHWRAALYNADLDLPAVSQRPDAVAHFRDQLARADGVVLVSSEYNYSIPGGLKNAIDWASRGKILPAAQGSGRDGRHPGIMGYGAHAMAFHPVFQFLDMKPVRKPEVRLPPLPQVR